MLDGWGFRPGREGNAIELGQTPVWHKLWDRASRTLLEASGRAVGLPEGQIGNSEVGHLNLGAGRVVPQDLVRISQSIESGEFLRIPALLQLVEDTRRHDGTLHVMGLIGTGGVHALDKHLLAAAELGRRAGVQVAIHAWLDGRDTPPQSGLAFMQELLQAAGPSGGVAVSTVIGRYYAMDRDKRWERTKLAYDAMVKGVGIQVPDPITAIQQAYAVGETDEFVKPRVITGAPLIRDGDGIFCFNYRADRMRQIVRALASADFDGFDVTGRPEVRLVTMTRYDERLPFPAAFEPIVLSRIVAEVLSDHGKTMFRTAETEKYAHVTYFFNGGYEPPYKGEERLLVPSQKVATYDLMPEMSAPGVTDVLQLRQWRYGRALRGSGGGGQGGRDGRRVSRAGSDHGRCRRRHRPGDRGSRQLRADDRPRHGRPAHRAHHESCAVGHGGRRYPQATFAYRWLAS